MRRVFNRPAFERHALIVGSFANEIDRYLYPLSRGTLVLASGGRSSNTGPMAAIVCALAPARVREA